MQIFENQLHSQPRPLTLLFNYKFNLQTKNLNCRNPQFNKAKNKQDKSLAISRKGQAFQKQIQVENDYSNFIIIPQDPGSQVLSNDYLLALDLESEDFLVLFFLQFSGRQHAPEMGRKASRVSARYINNNTSCGK